MFFFKKSSQVIKEPEPRPKTIPKFKRGDLVILKSGGPLMVVEQVDTPNNIDWQYSLRWYCKQTGRIHYVCITEQILESTRNHA